MKNINFLLLLTVISVAACTPKDPNTVSLSEREEQRYNNALQKVEQLETRYNELSAAQAPSYVEVDGLLAEAKAIKYNYNANGMNELTMKYCDALAGRITDVQHRFSLLLDKILLSPTNISLKAVSDTLLDKAVEYPLYMRSGEKLYYNIEANAGVTVRVYNTDTEKLIKTYNNRNTKDSLYIENSAIYLLEITPKEKLYADIRIDVRPIDAQSYNRRTVRSELVECHSGEFRAVPVPGIEMRKCFEEPRKFTLRGRFKAAFSGSAKALVAVQVPSGATDILYSLRIATSEQDRASDGEFHDNLSRSYKRIKFLGLPIYERSSSNGLLNTLLDDNRPLREEDAYCNMYVFRNQAQAKQFQDETKQASQLSYDVDYSTLGTQSCNGRIPCKGAKTIYLAFENERMRYANYIWVEVEAIIPNKVHYTTKYTLQ